MAWIRLDDDYIHHPKFTLVSDRAFRLWHEGMCFCRKLMTDGLIKFAEVKVFQYATPKAVNELTTPRGQSSALWVSDPEGYRVHDYLDWNPSQAEEATERAATKRRMRAYRGRVLPPLVTPTVTPTVTPIVTPLVTPDVTPSVTPHVPGLGLGSLSGSSLERERERKPSAGSRWPVYKGCRLVVFDWMLSHLQRTLGAHADSVEWDVWLDDADQRAMAEPVVAADWWPWLQAEMLIHARAQGWSVAVTTEKRPSIRHEGAPGSVCTHEPRCESTAECINRALGRMC